MSVIAVEEDGKDVDKRCALLPKGAFDVEFVGEHADAEGAVVTVHVAVVGAHIDYRRQAASVAGGKAALEEGDILHRLGCEH